MDRRLTLISGLLLGPICFLLVYLFVRPAGMSEEARLVLAGTVWMAAWWITEVVPIPVTALLPILLFPLTGAMRVQEVAQAYSDPIIFLFIGGFIVAVAIEKTGLHRRIALNTILRTGSQARMIILGFMLATAGVSMWISNTATVVMMLPIAVAITSQLSQESTGTFGKTLMLAIAYAASIGGLATLIGTPTNLILAGMVREILALEISFIQWFIFGFPLSMLLLALSWLYLTRRSGLQNVRIGGGQEQVRGMLDSLGRMSYEERVVAIVFSAMACCWIMRTVLLNRFLPALDDSMIALAGAIVLFMIPSRADSGRMLLDWKEAVNIPWGIILLFGGGFAIASGFQYTGLAQWIGTHLSFLHGMELVLVLLVVIATVNFLTEITSNMATASMILPVLAAGATAMEVHPLILMVGATLAASCAFMLPIATPPNAVVFGSGFLRIADMVRAGFWMNIVSIVILTAVVAYLLPLLWGLAQ